MVMVMRVNMMMMIGEGFKIPIFKISAFKDIRPPTHFLWDPDRFAWEGELFLTSAFYTIPQITNITGCVWNVEHFHFLQVHGE